MNSMKITAVVVTYNRLTLLQRTINALRSQTRKLNGIIVVDNGATDGTHEWLDAQTGLTVIHQENVGGSGGFWRGIKEGCERGFDWLWCMDDDVYPEPGCLEHLLNTVEPGDGILCPLRKQNGKIFLSEVRSFNFTNPFRSLYIHSLTLQDIEGKAAVSIEGIAFEGPLIRCEVVEKIGLPNKDLFLLYDDSDYSLRTVLAGYRVRLVTDAILNKELFFANDDIVTARQKGKWKLYYHIRNTVWFNRTYGRNCFVRILRPVAVLLQYELYVLKNLPFNKKYTIRDARDFLTAYRHGCNNTLGKWNRNV